MKRRVAVVTGSRAEYGLLEPVIRGLRADRRADLKLIVTGTHLEHRHGRTIDEIKEDGHPVAAVVPLGLSDDSPRTIARAMSRGLEGFAEAYRRLAPDVIVVLGDRFEILSAAAAAVPLGIPVAHIHGGETTEGAWDEVIRHSISKLSHLHFPTYEPYARRLRQMGELPSRIFCCGTPALDRLRRLKRLTRAELAREVGLEIASPFAVATYHPETLARDRGLGQLRAMLAALARFPGAIVFTAPNADAGGAAVRREIARFARARPGRAKLVDSLGHRRYFSALDHADVMIGNSSSGLLEAPFFGLPVVNLGGRQAGRLRRKNVVDVPRPTAASVSAALRKALEPRFKRSLQSMREIDGTASPARKIVAALLSARLGPELLRKKFNDLECEGA